MQIDSLSNVQATGSESQVEYRLETKQAENEQPCAGAAGADVADPDPAAVVGSISALALISWFANVARLCNCNRTGGEEYLPAHGIHR